MMKYILSVFIVWRLQLELIAFIAKRVIPIREGFLGEIPWSNFDGIHYLSIAKNGYAQYEQAFFPFYPLLISWLSPFFGGSLLLAAMVISNVCFIGVLVLLWKIVHVVFKTEHKKIREEYAKRVIIAVVVFPTSYYFGSVYTESLFVLLVLSSFYGLYQNSRLMFAFYAAIASATRLIGSLLLVPVGLISYMFYLYRTTGDALFFIHAQPAFGANRSGDELVILPQVLWRYAKIFYHVSPSNYDYWIAVLEISIFAGVLILLWKSWRMMIPRTWIYYSLAAIIVPTLTGTLSSMPRYVLVCFPLFFVIATCDPRYRRFIYIGSYMLLVLLTMLFVQGHWVS